MVISLASSNAFDVKRELAGYAQGLLALVEAAEPGRELAAPICGGRYCSGRRSIRRYNPHGLIDL
ncbi:hypothetical protein ABID26_000114 [Mesorhizobium shonense]|uniref:Uncharacterized protein n=1 Tax=Mesorhizobium shonense TaxID=1209948 RepID=A0ABV2HJK8_9HYPH|nr:MULTISPECIES: hypothetical protein [unclassified Mesorhizobium]